MRTENAEGPAALKAEAPATWLGHLDANKCRHGTWCLHLHFCSVSIQCFLPPLVSPSGVSTLLGGCEGRRCLACKG